MGCDIHIIVEYKHKDRWVGVHACESADHNSHALYPTGNGNQSLNDMPKEWGGYWRCEGRNYELFGRLSGVRGDGPAPNGLPPDISELAQMVVEQWGEDGHSHSHFTLRECGVHFLNAYAPKRMLSDSRVQWLCSFFGLGYHRDHEEDLLDNVRLIIFYDN